MAKKPTQLHFLLPLERRVLPPQQQQDIDPKTSMPDSVNKGKYTYQEVFARLSSKGLVKGRVVITKSKED